MHPFHRLYPVYNHPRDSHSNGRKDRSRRDRNNRSGSSDEEESSETVSRRKISPSRLRRNSHSADHTSSNIPVIKIGHDSNDVMKSPNKVNNILKAKEEALWTNHSIENNDNTKRLGPNTNNIIVESLRSEKK